LSPIFGAFATPAWWQAAHTVFTISSPPRAPGAAAGAPISTRPTGCRRAATDSGVIAFGSALGLLSTNCTSRMMPTIGTRNAARITAISCCGVLMKEECWSCSDSDTEDMRALA